MGIGDAAKMAWDAAKLAGSAAMGAAKLTGTALHESARFVARHQDDIASGVKTAIDLGGRVVEGAGSLVGAGADAASRALHEAGAGSQGTAGKVLGHTAGALADAVGWAGKVVETTGHVVQSSAGTVGAMVGGGATGVVTTLSGAVDSVAITDEDFEELHRRLHAAGPAARELVQRRCEAIERARQRGARRELMDMLVVGGITLADIVREPGQVPAEVERAFELAYPGLAASGQSLADAAGRMSADELVGLVNGVKGKLFELQLIEHLNDGNLPDGLHAELAGSATQPGHDILILDGDGQTVDLLQAKATESAQYVRDALERYPGIDASTTTEVHAQLVALGMADRVSDSGISEAALEHKVQAAVNGQGFDAGDLLPTAAGLAVVALSSFMDRSLTMEQRGERFGGRAAKVGTTGVAAKLVLVSTNTWWLGLAAGMGSHWLASHGAGKRERLEALRAVVETLEKRVLEGDRLAGTPMARLGYRP